MLFKKRELSPEQRTGLRKVQIALDIMAIILFIATLIYAGSHVKEIKDSMYDYCYLCEQQNENTFCYKRGNMIIWEGEDYEDKMQRAGMEIEEKGSEAFEFNASVLDKLLPD